MLPTPVKPRNHLPGGYDSARHRIWKASQSGLQRLDRRQRTAALPPRTLTTGRSTRDQYPLPNHDAGEAGNDRNDPFFADQLRPRHALDVHIVHRAGSGGPVADAGMAEAIKRALHRTDNAIVQGFVRDRFQRSSVGIQGARHAESGLLNGSKPGRRAYSLITWTISMDRR